jgi:major membrane immunogen (membrane-anchored lipoprotein)
MSFLGRLGLVLTALAGLALLTGCGETVLDSTKAEDTIQADLSKSLETKVKSVDCPSDVEVETGATFSCDVTLAGGEEQIITLRIENEDADLSVTNLRPANE